MKEEKSNDKETRTKLLYRENVAEVESEAENSKYDSEEGKDSDEEIKKTSIETKSINNKPSIQLISNIPPTKRILLTTQRTLVYKYCCGHTKRIKYTLEKIYTTNKTIRRDAISKIKEHKETKLQCMSWGLLWWGVLGAGGVLVIGRVGGFLCEEVYRGES